jgi:hypothetical protein
MISMDAQFRTLSTVLVALGLTAACSNGVPLGPSTASTVTSSPTPSPAPSPTPSPTPTTPTNPGTTTTTTATVAYTPDLQPIFNSDCVPCHGGRQVAARYSMTTYAGVMVAVTPRSASSALVIVTQPGGLMYPFLSGDRASKAAMIRTWVVNGAPQNR